MLLMIWLFGTTFILAWLDKHQFRHVWTASTITHSMAAIHAVTPKAPWTFFRKLEQQIPKTELATKKKSSSRNQTRHAAHASKIWNPHSSYPAVDKWRACPNVSWKLQGKWWDVHGRLRGGGREAPSNSRSQAEPNREADLNSYAFAPCRGLTSLISMKSFQ